MNELFGEFKYIFKNFELTDDIINMYLVFMGVRSACLVGDINLFYVMPKKADLEIYFGRYPGYSQKKFDYPLVCLKDSLVSKSIQAHDKEFTDHELGLYLGFNCFNQDWSNLRIDRYGIRYSLGNIAFYDEVCSRPPDLGMLSRIEFKAKVMTAALKLIDPKFVVKYSIEFMPGIAIKSKRRTP
jgi:hypothetical protein